MHFDVHHLSALSRHYLVSFLHRTMLKILLEVLGILASACLHLMSESHQGNQHSIQQLTTATKFALERPNLRALAVLAMQLRTEVLRLDLSTVSRQSAPPVSVMLHF